jgi:NB-ARC domain
MGKLYGVPDLPPHYVPRAEDLAGLKTEITRRRRQRGHYGTIFGMGVQGMGGIRKTVLAAALAHDSEVRQAFRRGIYWLTIGQKPNLLDLQNQFLRQLINGF